VLSDETLSLGMRCAAALLGVDALYRAESGDETGLVVLDMSTAGEIDRASFATYDEARREWEAIRRDATRLPESDRRQYYDQLCASTLSFIAWRTTGLPFRDQLSGFLHVPDEPVPDDVIRDILTRLYEALGGLGYAGELAASCAAWQQHNRVAAADVGPVLSGLLDEAWDTTTARLLEIPADRSDAMRVATTGGVAWNARCNYIARTIEVNTDPILTRPGLKHLAAHEGCPGHYVQFKWRETMFRQGKAAADVLLSVVNTASSSVFEGIADSGMTMCDVIDEDDRVQSLLNRHRAAIATRAAWQLHEERVPAGRVADELRARCLVGGDGWVTNRMRFIEAPARAVLIWSYWAGEPAVTAAWHRVEPAKRQEFLAFLYSRMHSPQTVGRFE
jgi:hypothetical protein